MSSGATLGVNPLIIRYVDVDEHFDVCIILMPMFRSDRVARGIWAADLALSILGDIVHLKHVPHRVIPEQPVVPLTVQHLVDPSDPRGVEIRYTGQSYLDSRRKEA